MKNTNYNLLKLLHSKLDTIWRLEKFYINDSKAEEPEFAKTLEKILAEEKKHVELLTEELGKRAGKSDLN